MLEQYLQYLIHKNLFTAIVISIKQQNCINQNKKCNIPDYDQVRINLIMMSIIILKLMNHLDIQELQNYFKLNSNFIVNITSLLDQIKNLESNLNIYAIKTKILQDLEDENDLNNRSSNHQDLSNDKYINNKSKTKTYNYQNLNSTSKFVSNQESKYSNKIYENLSFKHVNLESVNKNKNIQDNKYEKLSSKRERRSKSFIDLKKINHEKYENNNQYKNNEIKKRPSYYMSNNNNNNSDKFKDKNDQIKDEIKSQFSNQSQFYENQMNEKKPFNLKISNINESNEYPLINERPSISKIKNVSEFSSNNKLDDYLLNLDKLNFNYEQKDNMDIIKTNISQEINEIDDKNKIDNEQKSSVDFYKSKNNKLINNINIKNPSLDYNNIIKENEDTSNQLKTNQKPYNIDIKENKPTINNIDQKIVKDKVIESFKNKSVNDQVSSQILSELDEIDNQLENNQETLNIKNKHNDDIIESTKRICDESSQYKKKQKGGSIIEPVISKNQDDKYLTKYKDQKDTNFNFEDYLVNKSNHEQNINKQSEYEENIVKNTNNNDLKNINNFNDQNQQLNQENPEDQHKNSFNLDLKISENSNSINKLLLNQSNQSDIEIKINSKDNSSYQNPNENTKIPILLESKKSFREELDDIEEQLEENQNKISSEVKIEYQIDMNNSQMDENLQKINSKYHKHSKESKNKLDKNSEETLLVDNYHIDDIKTNNNLSNIEIEYTNIEYVSVDDHQFNVDFLGQEENKIKFENMDDDMSNQYLTKHSNMSDVESMNTKNTPNEFKEEDCEDSIKIIILGLSNSGKTKLQDTLGLIFPSSQVESTYEGCKRTIRQTDNDITNQGQARVIKSNVNYLRILDICGQNSKNEQQAIISPYDFICNYLVNQTDTIQGIIQVIDSSDRKRIKESSKELKDLLNTEAQSGLKVLILANKQDLQNPLDKKELKKLLDLKDVNNKNYIIRLCSCFTNQGIKEALKDFVKIIN